jgi:hypothetical protein
MKSTQQILDEIKYDCDWAPMTCRNHTRRLVKALEVAIASLDFIDETNCFNEPIDTKNKIQKILNGVE